MPPSPSGPRSPRYSSAPATVRRGKPTEDWSHMTKNAEVERWFKTQTPPSEAAMRRVRAIILGADKRMSEYLKYGTVQFAYEGDFASFVKVNEPGVNLMLMRGGRLK